MEPTSILLLLAIALLTLIVIYRRRWRQALNSLSHSRAALLRLYGNYNEASHMMAEERELAAEGRADEKSGLPSEPATN